MNLPQLDTREQVRSVHLCGEHHCAADHDAAAQIFAPKSTSQRSVDERFCYYSSCVDG